MEEDASQRHRHCSLDELRTSGSLTSAHRLNWAESSPGRRPSEETGTMPYMYVTLVMDYM